MVNDNDQLKAVSTPHYTDKGLLTKINLPITLNAIAVEPLITGLGLSGHFIPDSSLILFFLGIALVLSKVFTSRVQDHFQVRFDQ